jgi:hypothetical protein
MDTFAQDIRTCRRDCWLLLALVCITFGLYAPALDYGFV